VYSQRAASHRSLGSRRGRRPNGPGAASLRRRLTAAAAPLFPAGTAVPFRDRRSVMSRLRLGFPFTDHLVLQRDRPNAVWGWDEPGQLVTLRVEASPGPPPVSTRADATGAFRLRCPPLPAGGPYRLVIEGSEAVVVEDMLVGEVWLASGQSNMEWKLGSVTDADAEIAAAQDPAIRVLTVADRAAWEPLATSEGAWVPVTPSTAAELTAVGTLFARELRRHLGVPVGIIDAAWGGTPIAAWLSPAAHRALDPGIDQELARLRAGLAELPELEAAYAAAVQVWERGAFPPDPPNSAAERGWARPDLDDGGWATMRLPGFWQDHGMRFNGVVWFRRAVEIPAAWAGRELTLSLGAIDDFDHTYFDGVLVGAHPSGHPSASQIPREYRIPGRLVRAGRSVIAVRVFDHYGQGGFAGPSRALWLGPVGEPGEAVSLTGDWRLFAEHPIPLVPSSVWATCPTPPLLLRPHHVPGALHHGMIAPLLPYGLRGILWYQGESDVERHARYLGLQIALIRDLRAAFGQGQLPFLLVELAGHRGGPAWPFLREAQQQARIEPGTELATARDRGDPDDIHPRDKQEVARRLALVARARVYGEAGLVCSGPELDRVAIDGSVARIWFRSARGLRSREPGAVTGFELAGADGIYHAASARLVDDHVAVTSAAVPAPVTVRYAWSDTGEGSLENDAGLPALSFRTDGAPCPVG